MAICEACQELVPYGTLCEQCWTLASEVVYLFEAIRDYRDARSECLCEAVAVARSVRRIGALLSEEEGRARAGATPLPRSHTRDVPPLATRTRSGASEPELGGSRSVVAMLRRVSGHLWEKGPR